MFIKLPVAKSDLMRHSDFDLVRKLPLFGDMTAAHFDTLVGAALLQRFPAQVTLIREGEVPDFLHILIEGEVELFATWDERETTIEILHPVTTFILAAVIRDEVHLKSARTLTPARILMLPVATVRDVFGRDAAFARAIVSDLARRYRSITRILKNQKLRTGSERLANWVLGENQRQGGNGRVVLTHDKRTLSSLLGMTPENLSRNFADLQTHGVRSVGREIVISDSDALKRYAKPDPLIDEPQ
jgi:CRP/FNR family transcriptional regulator, transcriptional activator FtrB